MRLVRSTAIAVALAASVGAGCSFLAPPVFTSPDISLECGPVQDRTLCLKAVEVAATAKINTPPIDAVTIRLPDHGDPCATWLQPCGVESVIVELQSGDTIQAVPLVQTTNGWVRLDLVR
jgi:hypothetical protein